MKRTIWQKENSWNSFDGPIKSVLLQKHDLLIAKLHAYGLVKIFHCFLFIAKQNVNKMSKINNTYSAFDILLSRVPQGSLLDSIFFNIFIDDIFLSIKNSDLRNFADDNAISSVAIIMKNY